MDVVKPVNYPREYDMLFKPFVKEEEEMLKYIKSDCCYVFCGV